MPEYYYLKGKDQLGPFNLEEMKKEPIQKTTLVWHDGLPEWLPAGELPELRPELNTHRPPPPPVAFTGNEAVITVSTTIKKPKKEEPGSVAANLKKYRWTIGWILFHLLALVLSLKEIRFFNATGEPKPEKFWPFVKFTNPFFDTGYNRTFVLFNGMFTQYDWTEFFFYAGGAVFLMVLMIVYKKSS